MCNIKALSLKRDGQIYNRSAPFKGSIFTQWTLITSNELHCLFWARKNFLLFVLLPSRQSCNTSQTVQVAPRSTAHSHHPLFLAFLVTLLILDAICFINTLYFDILNSLLKRLIELIKEAKKEGREATLIYHKLDIDGERNRPSVTKNNNTGLS